METNANGVTVKTSVNSRPQNRKVLWILLLTIAVVAAISFTYIIIYPSL